MKIATSSEMSAIDMSAVKDYGIKSSVLMSRAGSALADHVHHHYPSRNVLVLCGCGNNGGDGLVAARRLRSKKHKVRVVMLFSKKMMSLDCLREYKASLKSGIKIEFCPALKENDLSDCVIVDAIFGTGLKREVVGYIADVISLVNASDSPVVAADIPSGISAATGSIKGAAVKADHTVTFGLPKRGHFLYPGDQYTSELLVEDIGFPEELLSDQNILVELSNMNFISGLFSKRARNSHKGDYGHVLVVAGSKGKTGAARLAGRACLRSGAGLVTIGVPASLVSDYQSSVVEEMIIGLSEDCSGLLSDGALKNMLEFASSSLDVIAIGPGIGVSRGTENLVSGVVSMSPVPLVIDADGLNSLCNVCAKKKDLSELFQSSRSPIVMTPHPGEMKRLCAAADIKESDRLTTASELAKKTGAVVLLKGSFTIVADPDGRSFINPTGNPGMATAGSGDVLTGIIAAFVGQGIAPFHAATAGAFIHGLAGDIAADTYTQYSLIASDIIECLPQTFCMMDIA
ncbi:MAG: NAD(P)H-hydrate dehydratase [Nitrospirae bacterium]|nr:NAD(P)H-hydrate dehydratase [Nitrospirota bacterium]